MTQKELNLTKLEQVRFEKSWQSFNRQYDEWKEKNYAMDERLTKEEYFRLYEDNRSMGKPNIARTLADDARLVSYREARRIQKSTKDAWAYIETEDGTIRRKGYDVRERVDYEVRYEENKKGKLVKKIIGGHMVTRHIDLEEYNLTPDMFTVEAIKRRGISKTYNMLREAGLTEREAGKIVDEGYVE